jgi:hypothetical protein
MRRWIIAALFILPFITPAKSWAWGCTGHQVVAYIAAQNLNPTATEKVADLLSDVTYGDFKRYCAPTKLGNMEFYATWADDSRTDANGAWHFWDIPLADKTAAMPAFCDGAGCVVSALKQQIAILQDTSADRAKRQQALMFVIHFLGDEHQPLHEVDNGDRGGNCVPVSFEIDGFTRMTKEGKDKDGNPNGSYSPNLHSIWDSSIIETMTGIETADNRDQLTQAFADSIAKTYKATIKGSKSKHVNFDTDFEAWAVATHKLAGPKVYNKLPAAIPVEPHPALLTSCLGVSSKYAPLNEVIGTTYVHSADPVIRRQLALAGGRLAAVLNTVWPNAN